jgi:hypothetical protein
MVFFSILLFSTKRRRCRRYMLLTKDVSWKVRRTVAASICHVAKALNADIIVSDLFPVFDSFCRSARHFAFGRNNIDFGATLTRVAGISTRSKTWLVRCAPTPKRYSMCPSVCPSVCLIRSPSQAVAPLRRINSRGCTTQSLVDTERVSPSCCALACIVCVDMSVCVWLMHRLR